MSNFDQSKLFFIIAPDRSGTTLLQSIMSTFSNFCNTKESRIAGPASPSCWDSVRKLNDFSYLEKFIEENWTKEFFIEKSPPSITCLPQIYEKYPKANYIFLKRNPLKIYLSQMNLHYGLSELGKRVDDLGALVISSNGIEIKRERIMSKRLLKMILMQCNDIEHFPNRIEMKYEDLIEDLDSQLKRLSDVFNIKPNFEKAHEVTQKPSSSTTFRYGIKKLYDQSSKYLINIACRKWKYGEISL